MESYQHHTISRVGWRLLPFMMLLYFICFIDRANVGLAGPDMKPALGISEAWFGLSTGAFFLGYFLFEIPSNLLLHRFGARRWISRIMISWGIVSAGMALAVGPWSLTGLRILLGVAEAGFFPGMILYLTYWFPARTRGRMTALFVAAIPISSAIGAPVSGFLLALNGRYGLAGWQWLFLLEGIPAVLVGLIVPFYLTNRPAEAKWLSADERQWLQTTLDSEAETKPHMPVLAALFQPSILWLSAVYFCLMVGLYTLSFWMPSVLKELGLGAVPRGLVSGIPFAAGAIIMFPWGLHSDRTGEREWHVVIAMIVGAVGAGVAAIGSDVTVVTIGFTLLSIGVFAAMCTFWPIPSARLKGTAAAGGIAMVNSIGNLGGFLGPYLIGGLKTPRFGFMLGLLATALFMALGAVVVALTRQDQLRLAQLSAAGESRA